MLTYECSWVLKYKFLHKTSILFDYQFVLKVNLSVYSPTFWKPEIVNERDMFNSN